MATLRLTQNQILVFENKRLNVFWSNNFFKDVSQSFDQTEGYKKKKAEANSPIATLFTKNTGIDDKMLEMNENACSTTYLNLSHSIIKMVGIIAWKVFQV